MLFVFHGRHDAAFTMADVAVPLDITFFAADGTPVDRRADDAVPGQGRDATCPVYAATAPYRYALETPGGRLPSGAGRRLRRRRESLARADALVNCLTPSCSVAPDRSMSR